MFKIMNINNNIRNLYKLMILIIFKYYLLKKNVCLKKTTCVCMYTSIFKLQYLRLIINYIKLVKIFRSFFLTSSI